MRFSEKLTRLMAQRRLTQGALAAALDVSQPSVGRWLNDAKPHRGTALLLAEYFQVPVEDLLDDGRELVFERVAADMRRAAEVADRSKLSSQEAKQMLFESELYRGHIRLAAEDLETVMAALQKDMKDFQAIIDRLKAFGGKK